MPYSRGQVRLSSPDPDAEPDVNFAWLDDPRDSERMMSAFHRMANVFTADSVRPCASDPFASTFSERIRKMSRPTPFTVAYTTAAGVVLDYAGRMRRHVIANIISEAPDLGHLLSNESALERYVRSTVTSAWHSSGTCRMGREDDPMSVADSNGKVIGTDNVYVADNSIMPRIPRNNTNIPAIMIGERMADLIPA
jgi:5-(hydroxymethyl)furfural/furfural oxidase